MVLTLKRKFGSFFVSILMFLCVAVLVFCLYQIIPKLIDYQHSDTAFRQIQDEGITDYNPISAVVSDEDTALHMEGSVPVDTSSAININWDAYKGTEIVAWFQMDDISYPVMQHSDNDYYLHKLPDGSYSGSGSLFLLNHNNPLLTDQSSFIYGHNMKNGSMFGKLKNYASENFKDHIFSIYLPDGTRHVYQFFSVATVYQSSKAYTWSFESDDTFLDWQNWMQGESLISTSLKASKNAKFVTLSTCNGSSGTDHRLVICGQEIQVDHLQASASWYQEYMQKYDAVSDAKYVRANEINEQLLSYQRETLEAVMQECYGREKNHG